jgi:putative membrane protein
MKPVIRYLGVVAAFVFTVYLVPGVSAPGGWVSLLLVALVWSAITLVIRPVLSLLTLPVTILTLGLFSLVMNALLFWMLTALVPGFHVAGFASAFIGVIVLSIAVWLINVVFAK